MYLRINSPNVVRECFDGEVVLVNLENGTYYSLERAAATIWLLFEQGLSSDTVVTTLATSYQVPVEGVRRSVERFVEELASEGLIVRSNDPIVIEPESGATTPMGDPTAQFSGTFSEPFAEPTIRKYSDMQDLLLLDPIHDVDQSGWPAAKQANES